MIAGDSLTISSLRRQEGAPLPYRRALPGAGVAVLALVLAGCTIEVGPPPESDPPLVAESERSPPPPPQPTEPQPWSRDLDFSAGPPRIDRRTLPEGLVAEEPQTSYSGERLTYQSAFDADKPPTEAELARERARQRAAAAGLPPPPDAAAAPVAAVSAEPLPPAGRQSRLPPPPKFPPLPPKEGEAAPMAAAETPEGADAAPQRRESRLPPPPDLPPLPAQDAAAAAPADAPPSPAEAPQLAAAPATSDANPPAAPPAAGSETAAAEMAAIPPAAPAAPPSPEMAETEAFVAEAWDAPAGTILVQVSAVQKKAGISDEWARLQARYPKILQPLRLVVDEAKLGDRGVFYRVQAGAFGTQDGATAACEALISQGQACFVVVR